MRKTWLALLVGVIVTAVVLGFWQVQQLLTGVTISRASLGSAPSTDGAMNVLLIGLDSRKDQDGNPLPAAVLSALHAGDSSVGGYNTNTLILVHVGADGRVTAFSIPRDDYVPVIGITGHHNIKIKEAYGLTKIQREAELRADGVTGPAELEHRSREAGREATLRAVHDLTGQPIDYFAEVNLAGFYDVAQRLGGVDVCLNHAVHDDYSGADFPAGRQRLDGAQALAFVRQRHGLANGDLDRTHRQQAVLLSVLHDVKSSGIVTDLARLHALMDIARHDVVLSQGWGERQFRRIADLAGGDVRFETLPVVGYGIVDGQDVNIVDPQAIRAHIAAAINGSMSVTAGPDVAATGGGRTAVGIAPIGPPPDAGPPISGGGGIPCVN